MGNPTNYPLGLPVNESVRDELLEPGQGHAVSENIRWDTTGAASKRPGMQPLSRTTVTNGTVSSGRRIFAHTDKGVPVVVDSGGNVYAYSEQLDHWREPVDLETGPANLCSVSRRTVPGNRTIQNERSHVLCNNGYLLVVSEATLPSDGATYVILDATTMAVVHGPVASGSTLQGRFRLAKIGTRFVVLAHYTTVATELRVQWIDTASRSTINTGWSAVSFFIDDYGGGAPGWDYDVCSLEDRFAVAYENNSGGASALTVRTYNSSFSNLETTTVAGTAFGSIACAGSNADTLWIAFFNSATGQVRAIGLTGNALGTVKATATNLIASGGATVTECTVVETTSQNGAGSAMVMANILTGAYYAVWSRTVTTSAGAAVSGNAMDWYHVQARGRLVVADSKLFFPCELVAPTTVLQDDATTFLAEIPYLDILTGTAPDEAQFLRCAAVVAPRIGNASTSYGPDCSYVDTNGSKLYMTCGVQVRGGSVGVASYSTNVVEIDFAKRNLGSAILGNTTYVTGGALCAYDGACWYEVAFIQRPKIIAVTNAGAGNTTFTSTVRYIAVYVFQDASGAWHYSAPSDAYTLAGPLANRTINVEFTLLNVTQKRRFDTISRTDQRYHVTAEIYRSIDAAPFLLVASVPGVTGITYTHGDSTTVASTALYPALYTQPGTLGTALTRTFPPGLKYLQSYNGMLVGVGDDDVSLWHSGQFVEGEAPWFSPIFQQAVPQDGPITALAVLDGSLIVFKRASIYVVSGEPPADNGASGGLTPAIKITSDVGCVDSCSVVSTTAGVFFQSQRGIELLDRGRQVQWVGENIQSTFATYPIVTSAVLDGRNAVVIFTCATTETSGVVSGTGVSLVYSLSPPGWCSVDKVYDGAGSAAKAMQGACIAYVDGRHRYMTLDPNGYVLNESDSTYLDAVSSWVTMKVTTPWFKGAGGQGEHLVDRIQILAARSTDHNLAVALSYDYESSADYTRTFTRAEIAALGRQWLEVGTGNQRLGQSIRVTLTDATPTGGTVGTGRGATWVSLNFEGQPRAGSRRTASGAR